jgi:hypothetical protein
MNDAMRPTHSPVGPAGTESGTTLPRPARRALQLALALIVVYVFLDAIAQLLPPHYSPISQAESDLAVGPFGYIMTVNFLVRGLLSLSFLYGFTAATTIGRRTRLGVLFLGVWAVGAFVLAAFPTDVGTGPTVHGTVHLVTALVAFLAGAVGILLLSVHFTEEPRLAAFRTPALLLSILGFIALLAMFLGDGRPRIGDEVGGLLERIFLGLVLLWMALVSLHMLRARSRPDGRTGPP